MKRDACARLHRFWRGYLGGEKIWVVGVDSMRFSGLRAWVDVRASVRDVATWMRATDRVTELNPNIDCRARRSFGIHKYLRGGPGLMAMVSTHSLKALRMNFNEAVFDFGVAIHRPVSPWPGMGIYATFDDPGVHVVTESVRALVKRRENGYLSALSSVGLTGALAGVVDVVRLIGSFAYPSVWLPRRRVGEVKTKTTKTYEWH